MWVKKMHFSAKQWVHNEKKYQKNAFLKVQGLYADNLKYFKLNRSEVAFTPRI